MSNSISPTTLATQQLRQNQATAAVQQAAVSRQAQASRVDADGDNDGSTRAAPPPTPSPPSATSGNNLNVVA
ncbi:hypothetical protein LNV08_21910 [Paucibacter sp. TC2R-5]|uniref:hypothetical protein n=1 Tax=Paucibacter sp. TC2R-5 TaxID=2893555 RepID=UPI0021E3EEE5|nr:hypothetical protein [Paucibacter sp. TC2R-5]MCV2361629.1 hypothetical protein [Paucibacter sp. TC2R-5]